MHWTDDQEALREAVTRMGTAFSAGHVERDSTATFSRENWKLLGGIGLLGMPFAEQWGGLGQDLLTTMYVLEGLGHSCRDGGLSFSATTHMVSTGIPLQRFGSTALKERYLRAVCTGAMIGSHAITEPEGGSDVMNMDTTAAERDDGFVLNGSKAFVSNGPIADLTVVYARTGEPSNPAGITAFLVERDTPGLRVGEPTSKMGLRTSPLCELLLNNARVPRGNIIGGLGSGFLVLDHVMKWEILCSFIVNVGEMQRRLEQCGEYARRRTQFGRTIGSYQSVSNKIVDMRIDVETARKWLYDTAEKLSKGGNAATDIAISKLIASEANVRTALAAVQIFGGYGYTAEGGLEKDLRNAVAGTIYSGTSEVQRERLASLMGLHGRDTGERNGRR